MLQVEYLKTVTHYAEEAKANDTETEISFLSQQFITLKALVLDEVSGRISSNTPLVPIWFAVLMRLLEGSWPIIFCICEVLEVDSAVVTA